MSNKNNDIEKEQLHAKQKFFKSCVKHLNQMSWGTSLLNTVNKDCNFLDNYHLALYPDGMNQILAEFEDYINAQMLEILNHDTTPKKIREKISQALFIRITKILSKASLINYATYLALPQNAMITMESVCKGCDAIWRYAGDQSTDFNYYTKRGLLSPVYVAAYSYYLGDDSQDSQDTQKFINSSLEKVIKIGTLGSKIKNINIQDIPILRMFT